MGVLRDPNGETEEGSKDQDGCCCDLPGEFNKIQGQNGLLTAPLLNWNYLHIHTQSRVKTAEKKAQVGFLHESLENDFRLKTDPKKIDPKVSYNTCVMTIFSPDLTIK